MGDLVFDGGPVSEVRNVIKVYKRLKDASVNVFLFFSGGRASEEEGLSLCGAALALSPSTLIGWSFSD